MFRELPGLAKQFIMRLLHVQQAVPQAVVSSWVTHQYSQESQVSKETLTSLRVSQGSYLNGSPDSLILVVVPDSNAGRFRSLDVERNFQS